MTIHHLQKLVQTECYECRWAHESLHWNVNLCHEILRRNGGTQLALHGAMRRRFVACSVDKIRVLSFSGIGTTDAWEILGPFINNFLQFVLDKVASGRHGHMEYLRLFLSRHKISETIFKMWSLIDPVISVFTISYVPKFYDPHRSRRWLVKLVPLFPLLLRRTEIIVCNLVPITFYRRWRVGLHYSNNKGKIIVEFYQSKVLIAITVDY